MSAASVLTRLRRTLPALALLALVAGLLAAPSVALLLAPAVLLLAVLAHGVFPGEQVLARLRDRRARPRHRRSVALRPPRRPDVACRAGLRLAFALAVRPPPAGPVVCS